MPKMPVTVEFAATGFEAEPLTLTADNPTRDVMLSPADVLIEWNDRPGLPGDRATFPFEVRHRGPFVLSARSLRYECGTYEKFGAYLRNVDRNDAFTGLSPCVPGVVSSVSGYLDRGRYELVVWAQFGFGEKIRWATLTHPW